ncbi:vacuolar membrane protein-domain-containing protein [Syncephalis plumigaleata]|nr:vacuolar membrane protein-domain-containing protein [Syncephalis plumigaleata]
MREPVIAVPIEMKYTEAPAYGGTGLGDAGSINCKLTDNFAIAVQLLMGLIVCSSLLIKRQREYPRRPLVIWFFDVSKQAAGGIMLHTLNLVGSLFTGHDSADSGDTNPCVWYFLNILLDTTGGVFIIYICMQMYVKFAIRLGVPDMRSGYYGRPPRVTAWLRQLVVFVMALASMKLLVLVLLRIFPFFFLFGKWALAPVEAIGDTRVQVVVVMLIFPLIMNIIQFWLVDGVIKGGGRLRSKSYTLITADDDASNYEEGGQALIHGDQSSPRNRGVSRIGTPASDDSHTGLLEQQNYDSTIVVDMERGRGFAKHIDSDDEEKFRGNNSNANVIINGLDNDDGEPPAIAWASGRTRWTTASNPHSPNTDAIDTISPVTVRANLSARSTDGHSDKASCHTLVTDIRRDD